MTMPYCIFMSSKLRGEENFEGRLIICKTQFLTDARAVINARLERGQPYTSDGRAKVHRYEIVLTASGETMLTETIGE